MAQEIRIVADITPIQWQSTLHGEKRGNLIIFRGHQALVIASYQGKSPKRDKRGEWYTTFPYEHLDIISACLVKAGYKLAIKLND